MELGREDVVELSEEEGAVTAGIEPAASEDVVVVVDIDLGEVGFPIVDGTDDGFDAPDGDKTVVALTADTGNPDARSPPADVPPPPLPTVVETAMVTAVPKVGCTTAVGGYPPGGCPGTMDATTIDGTIEAA